jgi:hypothetical protein
VDVYLILLILGGLYSVGTVGITGGPSNGEHPLVVTLAHTICLFIFARGWPVWLYVAYIACLALCIAASLFGYGCSYGEKGFNRFWLARLILGGCYIAMVTIYLSVGTQ